MGNLKIFGKGFQTTNKKARMLIYLWLINFLFSLVIITPVYFLINRDYSRSLMGDRLLQGIDLLWLGDIIYKYQDILPALTGWMLFPAILFLALYVFLNGGIIGRVIAEDEKTNLSSFFGDCGKYFFRFLRVFLISAVGYIILFGVIFKFFSALFNLWTKNASTEWTVTIASNLLFLIQILLFSIVGMFFDYVKVRLVAEDSRKTLKATIANFSFIGKKFFKAWALYLLVGIISILLGIVFVGVSNILPKGGTSLIVLFIWQQIYIFSKMWVKVLFFSTEYNFLRVHKI
jgi:hypothetical protein